MTNIRVYLIFPATSLLLTLLVIPAPATASISQCSNQSGAGGYQYRGYYTTKFANQGVEGTIDVDNLKVDDPDHQHALLYLTSQSQADGNAPYGSDWVQVGYGAGTVDASEVDVNHVYMEKTDYTTSPTATFYSYDTGNQYFQVFWTQETDSSGRGQYYGVYGTGSDTHVISKAWHVDPNKVQFFAQFEGATDTSTVENCPLLNWGLLGSTGDINNVQENSNTELTIFNTQTSTVDWSPSIDTTNHDGYPGNYGLITWNEYDLIEIYGS